MACWIHFESNNGMQVPFSLESLFSCCLADKPGHLSFFISDGLACSKFSKCQIFHGTNLFLGMVRALKHGIA